MEDSKRARSWKRRIRPRINLKNDEPVLYSTQLLTLGSGSPYTPILLLDFAVHYPDPKSAFNLISESQTANCSGLGQRRGLRIP